MRPDALKVGWEALKGCGTVLEVHKEALNNNPSISMGEEERYRVMGKHLWVRRSVKWRRRDVKGDEKVLKGK